MDSSGFVSIIVFCCGHRLLHLCRLLRYFSSRREVIIGLLLAYAFLNFVEVPLLLWQGGLENGSFCHFDLLRHLSVFYSKNQNFEFLTRMKICSLKSEKKEDQRLFRSLQTLPNKIIVRFAFCSLIGLEG